MYHYRISQILLFLWAAVDRFFIGWGLSPEIHRLPLFFVFITLFTNNLVPLSVVELLPTASFPLLQCFYLLPHALVIVKGRPHGFLVKQCKKVMHKCEQARLAIHQARDALVTHPDTLVLLLIEVVQVLLQRDASLALLKDVALHQIGLFFLLEFLLSVEIGG